MRRSNIKTAGSLRPNVKLHDLTARVNQLSVDLARLAEREKLKDQLFNQALQIERLKLENERLKASLTLPPATELEDQS